MLPVPARKPSSSLLAGIALAAGLLAPQPARALEPVRLSWVRAEGAGACAGEQTIADGVRARLGQGAISPSAPRSIEAVVLRSDNGFRAMLYVRDATGQLTGSRELTSESDTCASIQAASVLAIALAIDPDAALRPPVAPPAPSPAPPPVLAPPVTPPVAPPVTPAPSTTGTFPGTGTFPPPPVHSAPPSLRPPALSPGSPSRPPPDSAGAGLSFRGGPGLGLLPTTGASLLLGGFVALAARVELTAEALWMPEVRTSDRRFAFGLTALSLGACWSPARTPFYDFGACAAVWAGALHAVVFDLLPQSPGDYAWGAFAIAPRLRINVSSRVHLDLGVSALLPFARREFRVDGVTAPVFQQAVVTILPFLGGGVHFL